MRIETIRIAGFRGFRKAVEVRVPAGFLIVAGRNGSGKSTICDAIEYALTGSIERYSNATETNESISDYVWWRGDEPAEGSYVEIDLRDQTTNELKRIRRDRSGRFDDSCLGDLFTDSKTSGVAMAQFCLTSIIRDDTIDRLSFDLSETKRAALVQAAVGSGVLRRYETLLQACVSRITNRFSEAQKEFDASCIEVVRLREEVAAAQSRLSPSADVIRSEQRLRELVGSDTVAVSELLLGAEREQTNLRRREQQLMGLLERFDTLMAFRKSRSEREAAVSEANERLRVATNALDEAKREVSELRQQLARAAEDAPSVAALARLHSAGSELGLNEGRCPLCLSHVALAEFSRRLEGLQAFVEERSANLGAIEQRYSTVCKELERWILEDADARRLAANAERAQARLAADASEAAAAAVHAGFESDSVTRKEIEQQVITVRAEIGDLHRAASVLETQSSLDRVSELLGAISLAQRLSDQLFARLQEIAAARNRASEALHAVQTLAGTITHERLGSISPLLSNLYSRMRPHPDWRQVQYRLRGEVRRFLSLLVGPELNPRFVFSSGQRRAAGLAFLLAVHLSRSERPLNSLVLDDPVQHIDDFRALQLIEVLSAIRQSDTRQVICTVEDPELSVVMARRLRPNDAQPGAILRLQTTGNGESELAYEEFRAAGGSVIRRHAQVG